MHPLKYFYINVVYNWQYTGGRYTWGLLVLDVSRDWQINAKVHQACNSNLGFWLLGVLKACILEIEIEIVLEKTRLKPYNEEDK